MDVNLRRALSIKPRCVSDLSLFTCNLPNGSLSVLTIGEGFSAFAESDGLVPQALGEFIASFTEPRVRPRTPAKEVIDVFFGDVEPIRTTLPSEVGANFGLEPQRNNLLLIFLSEFLVPATSVFSKISQ